MADKIAASKRLVVIEYREQKRSRKGIYNVFARCLQIGVLGRFLRAFYRFLGRLFAPLKRQFEAETGTREGVGIRPQLAAMIEHRLVRKRESQAHAVFLARADEGLK